MREIFVDYEIANKMRGLGFREPCIASINYRNCIFLGGDSSDPSYIPTPTWDQSFDWLIKTVSFIDNPEYTGRDIPFKNYAHNFLGIKTAKESIESACDKKYCIIYKLRYYDVQRIN